MQSAIDNRMIKARQKMLDIFVPNDLNWTATTDLEMRSFAELLVIMAQLNNGIQLETGETLREKFAKETILEDRASFFNDYDIFEAWNKKELSNTRIRNMRKAISQMYN